MPCKSCEERRRMIREAHEKDGIKGVLKAAPAVAKHIIRQKPITIRGSKP